MDAFPDAPHMRDQAGERYQTGLIWGNENVHQICLGKVEFSEEWSELIRPPQRSGIQRGSSAAIRKTKTGIRSVNRLFALRNTASCSQRITL